MKVYIVLCKLSRHCKPFQFVDSMLFGDWSRDRWAFFSGKNGSPPRTRRPSWRKR